MGMLLQNTMKVTLSQKPRSGALKAIFVDQGFFSKKGKKTAHLKKEFLSNLFLPSKDTLLVCIEDKEHPADIERMRRACAVAIRKAQQHEYQRVHIDISSLDNECEVDDVLQALAESAILTAYRFEKKSKQEKKGIMECTIGIPATSKRNVLLRAAATIAQNTCFVRDLVNESTYNKTPEKFVSIARKLAGKKMDVKVLQGKQLDKFGLLSAVGQGSAHAPKMLLLEYKGTKGRPTALVGKGVVFDSGGLNLKPTRYIESMRMDMAGAATVLGIMKTIRELSIKRHVIAVLPIVENMIGPKSFKPGDVYTAYDGTTVEIGNTDAEGRLILADALSYVRKQYEPEQIIDFATLTGACLVAFGEYVAGIMGNNIELEQALIKSGKRTYELLSSMPLLEEYEEEMKGEVADLCNVGYKNGMFAGTITAAAFLKQFVGDTPWEHIDIAGTAWWEKERHYRPKNATGFGVRLIMDWVMQQ